MANESTQPQYGDEISRKIMTEVAQNLAQDVSYLPPFDTFQHMSDSARTITLFQALPLSLDPDELESIKTHKELSFTQLNAAQQKYLRVMLTTFDNQPADFSSITLSIDPTHEKDDDHAHIVVKADSNSQSTNIDAFLANTNRANWY